MVKNYTRTAGKYAIQKMINGQQYKFGRYPDKETVERMVEELRKVDWDKRQYPALRKKLRKEGYSL